MTARAKQKEERRAELLRVALAEFNEKGFHGASTRAIAATAGISSGLIFHYFSSKEAIYDELVRLGCSELVIDGAGGGSDPLAPIGAAAERLLDMLRHHPKVSAMFIFMAAAERRRGITAESDRLLDEHDIVRQTVPLIEAGQGAGVTRAGDPLALAAAFWNAMQGIAEAHGADPQVPLPEAEWLLAILRTPTTPKENKQ